MTAVVVLAIVLSFVLGNGTGIGIGWKLFFVPPAPPPRSCHDCHKEHPVLRKFADGTVLCLGCEESRKQ